MSNVVKDHLELVRTFREEQDSARSQAVRDFARRTLPTLENHLSKARQLANQVGVDSSDWAENAKR